VELCAACSPELEPWSFVVTCIAALQTSGARDRLTKALTESNSQTVFARRAGAFDKLRGSVSYAGNIV